MWILINGDSRQEFENEQYYLDAIDLLPKLWSKDAHIAEINQAHDKLVKSVLNQYNYSDMAELMLWAAQPESEYHAEANSIIEWYQTTCLEIENYANTVTENTALSVKDFINSLTQL